MSIVTKTGDDGTTALMYGRRVPKDDRRVCAYGAVDELNAALGTARAVIGEERIGEAILSIQKDLVILMGELAVTPQDRERYVHGGFHLVEESMVEHVAGLIRHLEESERISYDGWATPGATPVSAAFDVARTICRRAEREVVTLAGAEAELNPQIVRYLNRLSDLCWLWARWKEART